MPSKAKYMTWADRRERRERIVSEMGEAITRDDIVALAKKHGLHPESVYAFARTAGVRVENGSKQRMADRTYRTIAALLNGQSQAAIAKRLAVTHQRVAQVHKKMTTHGIYKAARTVQQPSATASV